MSNEDLYLVCRLAYNVGEAKVPWGTVVNALRQALGFHECVTRRVSKAELRKHPDLEELVNGLIGLQQ